MGFDMLVDTDVFVWYLRGNSRAWNAIERERDLCLTVVTYMELVQGMRDRQELGVLRQSLRTWKARMIHVSEEISSKAAFYVEQHYLSHSLQLADALIAATAAASDQTLLTSNDRHFRVVQEIEVRKFRP